MTSYFVEKSKWVVFDDISVIVDNSVEIGDFFIFFVTFLTKSSEKLWISWSIRIIWKKSYRFGQWAFQNLFISILAYLCYTFRVNQKIKL